MPEPPPELFRRQDETPDADFYRVPRLVAHIDDAAIHTLGTFFRTVLAPAPNSGGAGPVSPTRTGIPSAKKVTQKLRDGEASLDVLDLMSAYLTHLPPDVRARCRRVAGLGMNDAELAANPQLTDHLVHSLNDDPRLPYDDAEFDAALCTVSVQYLLHPTEVFAEAARVLRPGAPFIVSFSNRCFPTKATALWLNMTDKQHAALVSLYFAEAGGWTKAEAVDLSPAPHRSDPLTVVWAQKE